MLARLNWRPSAGEIRYFANTLAVLAVVLAAILAISGKLTPALTTAAVGIGLSLLCRFIPSFGRWIFVIWMLVTYVLSLIISPIAIAIIYYIILSPLAFLVRLFGKNELHLKRYTSQTTHFSNTDYDTTPESFRRQF